MTTEKDPRDARIAELEGEINVLRQELLNAREIIIDESPDFYGDSLPAELEDEIEFDKEIGNGW